MAQRKPINPFYILLVIAGVVFFVTASAYGVMTVKGLYPEANTNDTSDDFSSVDDSGLMKWIDNNGFELLMVELVLLAIFTFAAIGTDSYWSNRDANSSPDSHATPPDNESRDSH